MDNFSVIASLNMLFGLFLIPSPSEGYVVGYIDFSDHRLQSSLLKTQDLPKMNNKRSELEEDGGVIYSSPDRNPPLDKELFPSKEYYDNSLHDISSNQVAAENQNGETSQNENDIMFQSDDRKAEEERMKKEDSMLADAPSHKENDNNLSELKPNTIVYVQMTSSKL